MTILTALQEVNDSILPSPLIYADLSEANSNYTDKLTEAQYPTLLTLPIKPVDTIEKSGLLKTSFVFNAFFLTKDVTQSTIDYSSINIENACVAPMRLLARRFIRKLNAHSIIDPETQGITKVEYEMSYSLLDANLYGVEVKCTVPVIESPTGICV